MICSSCFKLQKKTQQTFWDSRYICSIWRNYCYNFSNYWIWELIKKSTYTHHFQGEHELASYSKDFSIYSYTVHPLGTDQNCICLTVKTASEFPFPSLDPNYISSIVIFFLIFLSNIHCITFTACSKSLTAPYDTCCTGSIYYTFSH